MSSNTDDSRDAARLTRRDTLAAGAAMPLAFWDNWSLFGDDQLDYELLRILNSETEIADGITQLDFGDNLSVNQTSPDGVRIDAIGGDATTLDDLQNVNVTGWLEGTFADRPASDDVPAGVRYWATDRDIAYRNTSNGWDVNGGTGTASHPVPEQHTQTLGIADSGTSPNEPGQLMRNGADVEVYSGGAPRNLSNIGATSASTGSIKPVSEDTDLQTAVDNANPGDILVGNLSNQRTISSTVNVTTDNLTISGFNIHLADNSDTSVLALHSCSGSTIENCHIDGNKSNQSVVSNFYGSPNGTACGIVVTNASRIRIRNNNIRNILSQGIEVAGRLLDPNPPGGDVYDVFIERNKLDGIGNGDILHAGRSGYASERCFVTENVITNHTQDVLNFIDGAQRAVFSNNMVRNGSGNGMAVEQHSGRGVDRPVRGLVFEGNYIETTSDGIVFDHPDYSFRSLSFLGNTLVGGSTGISVGSSFDIDGFLARNNIIDGFATGVDVQATISNQDVGANIVY